MSSKIKLLLLISVWCAISVRAESDEEDWQAFKKEHEKVYSSLEEEKHRFNIFVDNKRYVEQEETKASGFSFTQSLNSLSDLTTEEINISRNGFKLKLYQKDADVNESLAEELDKAWPGSHPVPVSLDWRIHGRVSPVKNQGSCGSCWAFAAVGSLEGMLMQKTNRSVLLSEQNLVDCSSAYGNHGCAGGLPNLALRYVQDNGIESSADYPYTAKNDKCKFNRKNSVMTCRAPTILPYNNENLLRRVVASFGPLPVAVDASARSFHLYKSGIYDDLKACSNQVNHAMLLVGYGHQQNLDYWLLKNSWSSKWGDRGYIKIVRNKLACGVATFAVLPSAA